MIDREHRARIASELDTSFVVEAAAGTGKTTALIGRMIALLRTGQARLSPSTGSPSSAPNPRVSPRG